MNKPLKMLLAVGVLAFTAAGMYYALLAPSKPSTPAKTSRPQPVANERLITPGAKVGGELPGSVPAGSAPSPALNAPATPAAPATSAASAPTASASTVPGFSPASEPMKALPQSLPGFDQTTTGATAPAAPGSAAPATPPSTPAPTAPAAAPATPAKPSTATPALPPLPAPSSATTGSAPTTAAPAPKPTAPAAVPAAPRTETYTVKEGDSLASIWRDLTGHERGWEQLQQANPGLDPSRLKIGQVLKVPDWKPVPGASKPAAPVSAPTATTGSYTVQSGDTLSTIATKVYGESKLWKRIYDANKDAIGSDPGALKVGQSLRIPPKSGDAAAKPVPAPAPAPAKPAPAPESAKPVVPATPAASPAAPTPAPKPQSL
jgi:nucleoid-associated protein YgaU